MTPGSSGSPGVLAAGSTAVSQPANGVQDEPRFRYRTIVKLKDPAGASLNSAQVVERLAPIAPAEYEYVRAMSGGAHVLVIFPRSGVPYEEVLRRLRAAHSVEYAEPDSVMTR